MALSKALVHFVLSSPSILTLEAGAGRVCVCVCVCVCVYVCCVPGGGLLPFFENAVVRCAGAAILLLRRHQIETKAGLVIPQLGRVFLGEFLNRWQITQSQGSSQGF